MPRKGPPPAKPIVLCSGCFEPIPKGESKRRGTFYCETCKGYMRTVKWRTQLILNLIRRSQCQARCYVRINVPQPT